MNMHALNVKERITENMGTGLTYTIKLVNYIRGN